MEEERRDEGTGAEEALVLHEEELSLARAPGEAGRVRARKRVETEKVERIVPRERELFDEVERRAPADGDTGEVETLPDGSVSIPILEEELVVTKRTVVRERVIVRKVTVVEQEQVEAELRRERLEIDADPGVEIEGQADLESDAEHPS